MKISRFGVYGTLLVIFLILAFVDYQYMQEYHSRKPWVVDLWQDFTVALEDLRNHFRK